MKVLTRTLTAKQYVAESFQRVIEHMTSDALRTNKTPRINIAAPEVGEVPPPPNFNEAVRAAAKRGDDDDFVAAEVNGVPAPPSLNASIRNFFKKGRS